MNVRLILSVVVLLLVFGAGIGVGRIKKPVDEPPEEPRATNSTWRYLKIPLERSKLGSDEAIDWLKANHAEGGLVGKRADEIPHQLCLAKYIWIGSRHVEFALFATGGENHPTAHVVIDLKTGLIADVWFGVMSW